MSTKDELYYDAGNQQLICQGNWNLANLPQLKTSISKLGLPKAKDKTITINGEQIKKMDSAGAWLLIHWRNKLKKRSIEVKLINFKKEHETLLSIIEKRLEEESKSVEPPQELSFVAKVGKVVIEQTSELQQYLAFIG